MIGISASEKKERPINEWMNENEESQSINFVFKLTKISFFKTLFHFFKTTEGKKIV